MSISTLVLIVLAVVVLVLIIVAATGGFGKIGDFFSNIGGGKSNVQTVLTGCQTACQTNSVYDYCNRERELTFDSVEAANSSVLVSSGDLSGRTISGVTCNEIQGTDGLGLACATISCPSA